MTGWARGPWLGFDTETTGVDPLTARLVTACVAYRSENDTGWTKAWLTDADGDEIPDQATAIHGVTTARAHTEGRPLIDVAEDIRERLQDAWANSIPVVAFNASYDLTLLNAELVRGGHAPLTIDGPVLDPLVIDRAVDRFRRGGRKLSDVCAHYDVQHTSAAPGEPVNDGPHTANADVLAALRVLWRIGKKFPEVAALDPQSLHEQEVIWHGEWCDSITAYWRSIGKGDSPERDWPIRRVAVTA